MTKDQWIKHRQTLSTISWDAIVKSGWDAVPCRCNKLGCLGWKLDKVKSSPYTKPLRVA